MSSRLSARRWFGWLDRVPVLRGVRRQWRRSLTLRVVTTTFVTSGVVVLVLGVILLGQVGHGLVDAKRRSALAEFAAGVGVAQAQLNQTDAATPVALEPVLGALVQQLSVRGSGVYSVVLLPTGAGVSGYDSGVGRVTIPPALRTAVVRDQAEVSVFTHLPQSTVAPANGAPPRPTEAFIVGAPLAAGTTSSRYELYFVFPLSAEQQSLDLVQQTFLVGGGVLLLLLALIAGLVTRQVVTPVRVAARVAARLSAGQLQQRMTVRGEDDLARLASTFNVMASNLQRQITRLEDLSRVQQRFTADVSHELRTPLTTVRMAAEMLHAARASYPPAVARSAELLISELDRFESMLGDLLEISRYDAGAAVLEADLVDIAGLVRSEADRAVFERGSTADIDTSAVPPAPVYAEVDGRRVSRIVRNLLSNAIEHGEGRPVNLIVASDEDAIALLVRDHGTGLLPGEADLVFGRFWRGDPSRARRTGSTGLGLSIALEDAHLHGGWLQAWGEPGAGAAFRLVLPRRAGAAISRAPLPLVPEDAGAVSAVGAVRVPGAGGTAGSGTAADAVADV